MLANIRRYVMIILGASVMGLALGIFLVPAQLAAGGVGGLATALNHLLHIPIGLMILAINIPIFIVGGMTFNKKFIFRSLAGTVSLSISTDIFTQLPCLTNDIILSSIFGGAVFGFGLGIAMKAGGTTGGSDILSLVLRRRFPTLSVGQLFIVIDGAVIAFAGLIFKRWDTVLYSTVTLFVSSRVVDIMLEGVNYAKKVYIISNKSDLIAKEIFSRINRGVTAISAKSLYTGNDKYILLCVIRKYELIGLKRLIEEIDSSAFVIVSDAKEVLGEGFYIPSHDK